MNEKELFLHLALLSFLIYVIGYMFGYIRGSKDARGEK